MKRYLYTQIIENELSALRFRMKELGRHGVKTSTLKDWCVRTGRIDLEDEDMERKHIIDLGFQQAMQSVLHQHGFRSVKTGYFTNLEECNDIEWLRRILQNDVNDVTSRKFVLDHIRRIVKERCNGQYEIDVDEDGNIVGYTAQMTEDEFLEELELDCV